MCPQTPTGRPYPSAAPSGPERLGCIRRCAGEGTLRVPTKTPRGVPIPPRPRQDRRDSGVTAAVLGGDLSVWLRTPTGRPYPSAAQAGPEGLGGNRRCAGEGPLRVPTKPPQGVPIPSAAQVGPEGLGCNRRSVGEGPLRAPPNPHGASLSPRGPGRTGGTLV